MQCRGCGIGNTISGHILAQFFCRVLSNSFREYLRIVLFASLVLIPLATGLVLANDKSLTVAQGLEELPGARLFTHALKTTNVWQTVVDADDVIVFVPSDLSLRNEGADFLLDVVLLKAENASRLTELIGLHVYSGQTLEFNENSLQTSLANQAGDCVVVQKSGENAMRVGPEAVVTGKQSFANGEIVFIDRLLWQAYDGPGDC